MGGVSDLRGGPASVWRGAMSWNPLTSNEKRMKMCDQINDPAYASSVEKATAPSDA